MSVQPLTCCFRFSIHNAYFKTAAWKHVRDHAKLLKDLELDDSNIFSQIKAKPALATAYLELHGMLKLIEASGQKELGLLAASTSALLGGALYPPANASQNIT
jgi:hypothetical protein